MVADGCWLKAAKKLGLDVPWRHHFWTILDSIYARARVNVNLELSRSGKPCQERISATGWARGSGQFAESAFDTLYVARNGG